MGQTASKWPNKPSMTLDVWIRIATAMANLERNGAYTHEGIYRVPGLGTAVSRGVRYLATGNPAIDISDLYKDEWASSIKNCLREFEPVTTYDMYDAIVAAAAIDFPTLEAVLAILPADVKERLSFILDHLSRLAAHSGSNKMNVSNLAKLWGGILARPDEEPAEDLAKELRQAARQFVFLNMLLEHNTAQVLHSGGMPTGPPPILNFPATSDVSAGATAVSAAGRMHYTPSPVVAAAGLAAAGPERERERRGDARSGSMPEVDMSAAYVVPARSARGALKMDDTLHEQILEIQRTRAPTTLKRINTASLASSMYSVRMERQSVRVSGVPSGVEEPEGAKPAPKGLLRRFSLMNVHSASSGGGGGGKGATVVPPVIPTSPASSYDNASGARGVTAPDKGPTLSFARRASLFFTGAPAPTGRSSSVSDAPSMPSPHIYSRTAEAYTHANDPSAERRFEEPASSSHDVSQSWGGTTGESNEYTSGESAREGRRVGTRSSATSNASTASTTIPRARFGGMRFDAASLASALGGAQPDATPASPASSGHQPAQTEDDILDAAWPPVSTSNNGGYNGSGPRVIRTVSEPTSESAGLSRSAGRLTSPGGGHGHTPSFPRYSHEDRCAVDVEGGEESEATGLRSSLVPQFCDLVDSSDSEKDLPGELPPTSRLTSRTNSSGNVSGVGSRGSSPPHGLNDTSSSVASDVSEGGTTGRPSRAGSGRPHRVSAVYPSPHKPPPPLAPKPKTLT